MTALLELDALDSHLSAGLEVARASTEAPAVTGNVNVTGEDLAVIFRILEQNELAQRISKHLRLFGSHIVGWVSAHHWRLTGTEE